MCRSKVFRVRRITLREPVFIKFRILFSELFVFARFAIPLAVSTRLRNRREVIGAERKRFPNGFVATFNGEYYVVAAANFP